MARPPRIQYPNAYYHVMNRGRGRRQMFHSKDYYEAFLTTLGEAVERFGIEVHAYCLMPNHYHLLVKTPQANLDRAMRHINGVYTQRYNAMRRTDGSLMRGRYKSVLVECNEYYLTLTRYIHRNPIEAKRALVDDLSHYPWSSYTAYSGLISPPPWLSVDEAKELLSTVGSEKVYQAYVDEGNDEPIQEHYLKDPMPSVFGGDAFKDWVQKTYLDPLASQSEFTQRSTRIVRPAINEIIDVVADYFQMDPSRVTYGRRGQRNIPRWIAMYLTQQQGGFTLREIAPAFGLNRYSGVATITMKLRRLMLEDAVTANDVSTLKQLLKP